MDSKLPIQFLRKLFLDIVDDDWIKDTLSDDEIEIPLALDVDLNGSESPTGEPSMWTAEEKKDRWNDLGLDEWVNMA
ncbi:Apc13p [Plasmopara halstedii]|uniref:Apc13p n=1 Tax=Plasmopara halstedii TaxID=4781 RepID=A0A0P1AZ02_PLAHL|nr:Apc13p [Plasmopara halstedii]CEG46601.1 Apc13p [Plasmopara halstedii]|eukprot:XP_024582970.1 Apc13p [Plasmopara halstedii]